MSSIDWNPYFPSLCRVKSLRDKPTSLELIGECAGHTDSVQVYFLFSIDVFSRDFISKRFGHIQTRLRIISFLIYLRRFLQIRCTISNDLQLIRNKS